MTASAATRASEVCASATECAVISSAGWTVTTNTIRSAAARTTGGPGTWCTATTTSATGFTDTTRFSHTACSSWFSNTTCTAGFSYTSYAAWLSYTASSTGFSNTAGFADTTNASDAANKGAPSTDGAIGTGKVADLPYA